MNKLELGKDSAQLVAALIAGALIARGLVPMDMLTETMGLLVAVGAWLRSWLKHRNTITVTIPDETAP